LCICHREDRTSEEEEEFLAEVEKVMGEGARTRSYDFNGLRFPEDYLRFALAEFSGDAHFTGAVFAGKAYFPYARFHGDASFAGGHVAADATFQDACFEKRLDFSGVTILGTASFRCLTVKGSFDGTGLTIGNERHPASATFRDARLHDNFRLEGATFHGDVSFADVDVTGRINLVDATFAGDADFRSLALPKSGVFFGMTAPPGRGDSLYRFAKQVCQNVGKYREAGDWYVKERLDLWYARFIILGLPGAIVSLLNPFTYLGYLFGYLIFRYGEGWFNVAVAAVLVILGSAWAYNWTGAIVDSSGRVLTGLESCLYFSIVAFTTLGFGDCTPMADNIIRRITAAEALLGAFLMAAFLVTLARRWGRG